MIRQAALEDFTALVPNTEAAVRILGQVKAYGVEQPFLRLWCISDGDTKLGFVSLLDGAATVALYDGHDTEELAAFLTMQPEVHSVRTSSDAAQSLVVWGGWEMETGAVMTPGAEIQMPKRQSEALSPRETYPLLTACFGDSMPPFSSWYVDVSHRVRHNCCHIMGIRDGNEPVACAMVTAVCDGAALIGAVATLPKARGKGYASDNVLALAHTMMEEGHKVFLSPKNAQAHALYAHIGFVECGQWGSAKRI